MIPEWMGWFTKHQGELMIFAAIGEGNELIGTTKTTVDAACILENGGDDNRMMLVLNDPKGWQVELRILQVDGHDDWLNMVVAPGIAVKTSEGRTLPIARLTWTRLNPVVTP